MACLAELNASHCVIYSVVCFSLKTSNEAEFFSFFFFYCSFEDLCQQEGQYEL